jgi:hypothetical protein
VPSSLLGKEQYAARTARPRLSVQLDRFLQPLHTPAVRIAWHERPIYGLVRYMSYASTSRKFDSRAYIARWSSG